MPRQPCPICGKLFQGNLVDHVNKPVKGSDGVTRCEWNLNTFRVQALPGRLREAGWVTAGAAVGRHLRLMQQEEELANLGMLAASGAFHTRVHVQFMDPEKDLKVWWTRPWVRAILSCTGWTVCQRREVLVDVLRDHAAHEVIEAADRIGGRRAVEQLDGGVVPARCKAQVGDWTKAILRTASGDPHWADWCVRRRDHEGQHKGARFGLTWD